MLAKFGYEHDIKVTAMEMDRFNGNYDSIWVGGYSMDKYLWQNDMTNVPIDT